MAAFEEHCNDIVHILKDCGQVPKAREWADGQSVDSLGMKPGGRWMKCTHWMGEEIPLVLDHIDGNPDNWNTANLRLICCNCDAQTPTYKGRNKGNGRFARRKRYAEGKSF